MEDLVLQTVAVSRWQFDSGPWNRLLSIRIVSRRHNDDGNNGMCI